MADSFVLLAPPSLVVVVVMVRSGKAKDACFHKQSSVGPDTPPPPPTPPLLLQHRPRVRLLLWSSSFAR